VPGGDEMVGVVVVVVVVVGPWSCPGILDTGF
jgi:hypothetical protein